MASCVLWPVCNTRPASPDALCHPGAGVASQLARQEDSIRTLATARVPRVSSVVSENIAHRPRQLTRAPAGRVLRAVLPTPPAWAAACRAQRASCRQRPARLPVLLVGSVCTALPAAAQRSRAPRDDSAATMGWWRRLSARQARLAASAAQERPNPHCAALAPCNL